MSSSAKKRRLSPSKPQTPKGSGGGSGPSAAQPSVLKFFGIATAASPPASAPSASPLKRRSSTSSESNAAARAPKAAQAGADADQDSDIISITAPSASSRGGSSSSKLSSGPAGSTAGSATAPTNRGSSSPAKDDSVPCPICARPFPYRQIAAHASSCLDFQQSGEEQPHGSCADVELAQAAPSNSIFTKKIAIPSCPASASTPRTNSLRSIDTSTSAPAAIPPDTSAANVSTETQSAPPSASSNVFAHLMKSHGALKQWASADAAEARNTAARGKSHTTSPRAVPFYKIVTGTPISVDAFRFGKIEGCTAYFLTHFHGDHYGGLTPNWRWGPIYGSRTTCALVKSHLGVHAQWVRELPMEEKVLIPDTGGVYVTLLDANHCPGSNLFLFEGPQTGDILRPNARFSGKKQFRALHCGDFRASPRHTNDPHVLGVDSSLLGSDCNAPLLQKASVSGSSSPGGDLEPGPSLQSPATDGARPSPKLAIQKIDTVYLDTTYLNPRYCFPAQEQVVQACADLVLQEANRLRNQIEAQESKGDRSPLKREGSDSNIGMMGAWLSGHTQPKKEEPAESGSSGRADEHQVAEKSSSRQNITELASRVKAEEAELDIEVGEEDLFLNEEGLGLEETQEADLDMASSMPELAVKAEPSDLDALRPLRNEPQLCEDSAGDALIKAEEEEAKPKDKKPFFSWLPTRPHNPNGRRRNRLLVLVGTYTIGKEKIVKACAKALNTRIFCPTPRKYDVYDKVEDPELHELLTRDPAEADVFVTNLSAINGQGLHDLVAELRTQGHDIKRAIAFRPTGWTYKPPAGIDTTAPDLKRLIAWNQMRQFGPDRLFATRDSTREYQIYGVPYSEHSSFFELTAFALSLEYDRIIATVNVGNPTSRAKMEKWFERWAIEKKRRQKAGEPSRLPSRTLDYW